MFSRPSNAELRDDLHKALNRLKVAGRLADCDVACGKAHLTLPDASSSGQALSRTSNSRGLTTRVLCSVGRAAGSTRQGVPSVHEPVGESQRSNPLPIEVDFDSQLEAIKLV